MKIKPYGYVSKRRLAALATTATLNVILITVLIFLQIFPLPEAFSSASGEPQSPTVTVVDQEESPLRITLESIDASDPLSPQVNYMVQNVSGKPVRAYTMLEEAVTSSSRGRSSTIINITSTSQVLQPNKSRPGMFFGQNFPEPLSALTLSIDFVEFDNGMTWGDDTERAAENLAGQRAGGREAIKKLRELLESQGVEAVAKLIKEKHIELTAPPAGKSEKWMYGFKVGHNTVFSRVKGAHEKGGPHQLVSELRKPFDASEGRQ